MKIAIAKDVIYNDKKQIGTVRNFCCGVDIRLDHHEALFSLLRIRKHEKAQIVKCVKKLLSIDSLKSGHFNLKMEYVEDEKEWKDYADAISKP